jgi:enoyl-CoA hydratase/carnithine racemase
MSDILTHLEDSVLTITINRIEKKNSITSAMYADMAQALADAEKNAHETGGRLPSKHQKPRGRGLT